IPSMLMSARIPRIAALLNLRLLPFPNHGQESFVSGIELGLELRRIAARAALEDVLVFRHDLLLVFLDVAHRGVDLAGTQAEEQRDLQGIPTLVEIVQDIEYGDSRPRDLGPPAAVDDLGFEHGSSPPFLPGSCRQDTIVLSSQGERNRGRSALPSDPCSF